MAQTARMAMAVAVVAATMAAVPGAAAQTPEGELATVSHVRSANSAITALIAKATTQSATFRGLVETIDASDSYVYVAEGQCGGAIRACLVSVTGGNGSRFMFVRVELRADERDLMGSIGHELRHVVEIIEAPHVTDMVSTQHLYRMIGTRSGAGTQETDAAVQAGDAVRVEVRRSARTMGN